MSRRYALGQILEIVVGRCTVGRRGELDQVECVRDRLRFVQFRAEAFPQHCHDLIGILAFKTVKAAPTTSDLDHGEEGIGVRLQCKEATAEQCHELGK